MHAGLMGLLTSGLGGAKGRGVVKAQAACDLTSLNWKGEENFSLFTILAYRTILVIYPGYKLVKLAVSKRFP